MLGRHVYLCTVCMQCPKRPEERKLDSLGLELQIVLSSHVKEPPGLSITEPSLQSSGILVVGEERTIASGLGDGKPSAQERPPLLICTQHQDLFPRC